MTKDFPTERLQLTEGFLSPSNVHEGAWVLSVHFTPFVLGEQEFDGVMGADGLILPSTDFSILQNSILEFPINPASGYIDAWVSFDSVYNPVDISRLQFGTFLNGSLQTKITSRWIMSYENTGYADFDYQFSIPLLLAQD